MRLTLRILIPFLLVACAALVVYARRNPPPPTVPPDPVLDCPDVLDVGELEIYTQAVGRFIVANRGGADLLISDVRTSCGCMGLEQERGTKHARVTELCVPAGGEVPLVLRRAVPGPVGFPVETVVYFRTNDPSAPERAVRLLIRKVTGGVESSPRAVAFGAVPVGAVVKSVVVVTDESPDARAVARILASDPARLAIHVLPVEPPPPGERLGRQIARFEVSVATTRPGAVDERVEIYLDGRPVPTVVPVSGRVVAPVEFSPRNVFLPLRSDRGPLYEVTCVCRSSDGRPLAVRAATVPPGLSVHIPGGSEPGSTQTVKVSWDPAAAPGPAEHVVRLTARVGEKEYPVDITVHCEPPGGP